MNISSVHIIISVFIIIMTSNYNSDALLKSVLDPKALLKIHEEKLRTQKKQRAEKKRARRRDQYAAMDAKKRSEKNKERRARYTSMDAEEKEEMLSSKRA